MFGKKANNEQNISSADSNRDSSFEADDKRWLSGFIEKNLDRFEDIFDIEDDLAEQSDHLKENSEYLGMMDIEKTEKNIRNAIAKKNKILDLLISDAEKDGHDLASLSSDEFEAIAEEVTSKDENDADDLSAEVSEEIDEDDEDDDILDYDIALMIRNRIAENKSKKEGLSSLIERSDDERKENQKAEADKRAAILEKIDKLPSKKVEFDPQEELNRIHKVERKKNIDSGERAKIIKKFKNELVNQSLGIAEMSAHLEREICENKNFSLEQLRSDLDARAKELKLSHWQFRRCEKVLDDLGEKMSEVENFWAKHENNTAEEIFSEVFGMKPIGKVEIEKEKISITFHCHDIKDFARIFGGKDEVSDKCVEDCYNIGGFYSEATLEKLGGVVAINRVRCEDDGELEDTMEHEKKHMIDTLIKSALLSMGLEDEFGKLHRDDYIRTEFYEDGLLAAGMEIFAFYKSGWDTEDIYSRLRQDYFPFLKKGEYKELKKKYKEDKEYLELPPWKEYIRAVLTNKVYLKRAIGQGLELFEGLESVGFSRERIIALFQNVRLDFWPKHILRLESSESFTLEVKANIRRRLQELEEEEAVLEKQTREYKSSHGWLKKVVDYVKGNDIYHISKELKYVKEEVENLKSLLEALDKDEAE